MPLAVFYMASLGMAVLASWSVSRRRSAGEGIDRTMRILVPLALVTLCGLFFHKIRAALFIDCNWTRLQATFAFAKGFGPYYGSSSGPVLPTLYGPVSFLGFIPAVLARSPEAAMVIATTLAAVYSLLPVLCLHLAETADKKDGNFFHFFVFLCFVFIVFISTPLRRVTFQVHADAPALGLGALACGALYLRRDGRGTARLWLSALAAVFSVWSKQVAAPLIFALALYVWITESRGIFWSYLKCLFLSAVFISAVFVARFGWEELFFNLVLIPLKHPWKPNGILLSASKLFKEILVLSPVLFFSIKPYLKAGLYRSGPAEWVRSNRWALFLITGIFMIPSSILGFTKMAGARNAFCYALYYLLIAASLALCSSATGQKLRQQKIVAVVIMAVSLFIQIPFSCYQLFFWKKPTHFIRVAYEYAKKYPGQAYFPRATFATLLAEGRPYHDNDGLRDRQWAGFDLSQDHYQAHIPSDLKLIAFREGGEDDMNWSRERNFTRRMQHLELPGFRVYFKKPGPYRVTSEVPVP